MKAPKNIPLRFTNILEVMLPIGYIGPIDCSLVQAFFQRTRAFLNGQMAEQAEQKAADAIKRQLEAQQVTERLKKYHEEELEKHNLRMQKQATVRQEIARQLAAADAKRRLAADQVTFHI